MVRGVGVACGEAAETGEIGQESASVGGSDGLASGIARACA